MGILQEDMAEDVGAVPVCKACGSERVARDARACWNLQSGLWELEQTFDQAHCHACEGETTLTWKRLDATEPRRAVREFNDRLRCEGRGSGSILVTCGVQELGSDFVQKAYHAVRSFDDFSGDNDPWGEHDFGAVEVDGQKVFWKIDYYDPTFTAGSENPANEAVTRRVLTIMLAAEY